MLKLLVNLIEIICEMKFRILYRKNFIVYYFIVGDCPCAGGSCPTCGPSGFAGPIQPCGCAPTPICPPCLIAKVLFQILNLDHETNARNGFI
jgi:hypothetical protein